MRNELGKFAARLPGSARSADAPQRAKNSTTSKPARKQVSTSRPAAAAPDETAAPPQLRTLPSFPPPGATGASVSSTPAAQVDSYPAQGSGPGPADVSDGRVEPAAHEKLRAPAETPDGSVSSAVSVALAGSAQQAPVDDIQRSQPEPPKAAQAGQPRSSVQALPSDVDKASQDASISLPAGDHGNKLELDDDPTAASAVAAQPSSALPPQQLSAAVVSTLLAGSAQSPQASFAKLAESDVSAQAVDEVSAAKHAPSRKDVADGRDSALGVHAKAAPAALERKAAEAGDSRTPDAADPTQPREQVTQAHASDAVSNSFTQALAAERSKPPVTETPTQEPTPSVGAATPEHIPGTIVELQSARMTNNETQAEMQVGFHTADYGHVEIKTTLQNSVVGATIAVEHAALREQIASALPELRHSFTERQITLDSLTVSDSLSASTSFTNSHQQRSNQRPADVPYQGFQERPAEPDWESKSGASSGPVLQPWGGDSGSELNVLV
ncbi:MAG: flagellar hook-length control protein FliK [Candidatus Korobacteraceae bacterium]